MRTYLRNLKGTRLAVLMWVNSLGRASVFFFLACSMPAHADRLHDALEARYKSASWSGKYRRSFDSMYSNPRPQDAALISQRNADMFLSGLKALYKPGVNDLTITDDFKDFLDSSGVRFNQEASNYTDYPRPEGTRAMVEFHLARLYREQWLKILAHSKDPLNEFSPEVLLLGDRMENGWQQPYQWKDGKFLQQTRLRAGQEQLLTPEISATLQALEKKGLQGVSSGQLAELRQWAVQNAENPKAGKNLALLAMALIDEVRRDYNLVGSQKESPSTLRVQDPRLGSPAERYNGEYAIAAAKAEKAVSPALLETTEWREYEGALHRKGQVLSHSDRLSFSKLGAAPKNRLAELLSRPETQGSKEVAGLLAKLGDAGTEKEIEALYRKLVTDAPWVKQIARKGEYTKSLARLATGLNDYRYKDNLLANGLPREENEVAAGLLGCLAHLGEAPPVDWRCPLDLPKGKGSYTSAELRDFLLKWIPKAIAAHPDAALAHEKIYQGANYPDYFGDLIYVLSGLLDGHVGQQTLETAWQNIHGGAMREKRALPQAHELAAKYAGIPGLSKRLAAFSSKKDVDLYEEVLAPIKQDAQRLGLFGGVPIENWSEDQRTALKKIAPHLPYLPVEEVQGLLSSPKSVVALSERLGEFKLNAMPPLVGRAQAEQIRSENYNRLIQGLALLEKLDSKVPYERVCQIFDKFYLESAKRKSLCAELKEQGHDLKAPYQRKDLVVLENLLAEQAAALAAGKKEAPAGSGFVADLKHWQQQMSGLLAQAPKQGKTPLALQSERLKRISSEVETAPLERVNSWLEELDREIRNGEIMLRGKPNPELQDLVQAQIQLRKKIAEQRHSTRVSIGKPVDKSKKTIKPQGSTDVSEATELVIPPEIEAIAETDPTTDLRAKAPTMPLPHLNLELPRYSLQRQGTEAAIHNLEGDSAAILGALDDFDNKQNIVGEAKALAGKVTSEWEGWGSAFNHLQDSAAAVKSAQEERQIQDTEAADKKLKEIQEKGLAKAGDWRAVLRDNHQAAYLLELAGPERSRYLMMMSSDQRAVLRDKAQQAKAYASHLRSQVLPRAKAAEALLTESYGKRRPGADASLAKVEGLAVKHTSYYNVVEAKKILEKADSEWTRLIATDGKKALEALQAAIREIDQRRLLDPWLKPGQPSVSTVYWETHDGPRWSKAPCFGGPDHSFLIGYTVSGSCWELRNSIEEMIKEAMKHSTPAGATKLQAAVTKEELMDAVHLLRAKDTPSSVLPLLEDALRYPPSLLKQKEDWLIAKNKAEADLLETNDHFEQRAAQGRAAHAEEMMQLIAAIPDDRLVMEWKNHELGKPTPVLSHDDLQAMAQAKARPTVLPADRNNPSQDLEQMFEGYYKAVLNRSPDTSFDELIASNFKFKDLGTLQSGFLKNLREKAYRDVDALVHGRRPERELQRKALLLGMSSLIKWIDQQIGDLAKNKEGGDWIQDGFKPDPAMSAENYLQLISMRQSMMTFEKQRFLDSIQSKLEKQGVTLNTQAEIALLALPAGAVEALRFYLMNSQYPGGEREMLNPNASKLLAFPLTQLPKDFRYYRGSLHESLQALVKGRDATTGRPIFSDPKKAAEIAENYKRRETSGQSIPVTNLQESLSVSQQFSPEAVLVGLDVRQKAFDTLHAKALNETAARDHYIAADYLVDNFFRRNGYSLPSLSEAALLDPNRIPTGDLEVVQALVEHARGEAEPRKTEILQQVNALLTTPDPQSINAVASALMPVTYRLLSNKREHQFEFQVQQDLLKGMPLDLGKHSDPVTQALDRDLRKSASIQKASAHAAGPPPTKEERKAVAEIASPDPDKDSAEVEDAVKRAERAAALRPLLKASLAEFVIAQRAQPVAKPSGVRCTKEALPDTNMDWADGDVVMRWREKEALAKAIREKCHEDAAQLSDTIAGMLRGVLFDQRKDLQELYELQKKHTVIELGIERMVKVGVQLTVTHTKSGGQREAIEENRKQIKLLEDEKAKVDKRLAELEKSVDARLAAQKSKDGKDIVMMRQELLQLADVEATIDKSVMPAIHQEQATKLAQLWWAKHGPELPVAEIITAQTEVADVIKSMDDSFEEAEEVAKSLASMEILTPDRMQEGVTARSLLDSSQGRAATQDLRDRWSGNSGSVGYRIPPAYGEKHLESLVARELEKRKQLEAAVQPFYELLGRQDVFDLARWEGVDLTRLNDPVLRTKLEKAGLEVEKVSGKNPWKLFHARVEKGFNDSLMLDKFKVGDNWVATLAPVSHEPGKDLKYEFSFSPLMTKGRVKGENETAQAYADKLDHFVNGKMINGHRAQSILASRKHEIAERANALTSYLLDAKSLITEGQLSLTPILAGLEGEYKQNFEAAAELFKMGNVPIRVGGKTVDAREYALDMLHQLEFLEHPEMKLAIEKAQEDHAAKAGFMAELAASFVIDFYLRRPVATEAALARNAARSWKWWKASKAFTAAALAKPGISGGAALTKNLTMGFYRGWQGGLMSELSAKAMANQEWLRSAAMAPVELGYAGIMAWAGGEAADGKYSTFVDNAGPDGPGHPDGIADAFQFGTGRWMDAEFSQMHSSALKLAQNSAMSGVIKQRLKFLNGEGLIAKAARNEWAREFGVMFGTTYLRNVIIEEQPSAVAAWNAGNAAFMVLPYDELFARAAG
ncbi:hypothetical protein K2X33_00590, partial [bacterium]|nr:hypothetical protein [bacterium]